MKRIALIALCLFVVTGTFAQKKNVTTSLMELNKTQPDMDKVKTYLEGAAQDPSTKDYHKTWYATAKMYMKMMTMDAYPDKYAYVAGATDAIKKLVQLDANYEKQEVTNWIIQLASGSYMASREALTNKQYKMSSEAAQIAIDLYQTDNRFAGNKGVDTSIAAAQQILAYSTYNDNDYANAIVALEKFIANPIYNRAIDYSMLSNAYAQTGDNAKSLDAINRGRTIFPDDKQLRIDEINYYIKSGQQEVFIKKLQDAIDADPNNGDLHYFLAQTLADMANPTDKDGNALPRPTNYDDLMAKAEASYTKAVTLAPDNITYLYNFGAFYFNQSVPLNKTMNSLGSGPANDKKYDELNKEVKELYAKAMPNFQKVYDILEPKHASINAEDKSTLISTITVMREIHARNNNADESKALKAKLDEIGG